MSAVHHLNILAGQEYRMPVRLVDADGLAVPIADYDLYGAARRGSETTRMSVVVVDGSSCVAIIPPLEQASYTYDLYLRHRSTTAEVQLLAGNIAVRGRVASMPPVTGGGEDVVAVVSADMTEVQVTVTPIAVATPDAWDRLDRAGDLLAEAIETAGALVPDAQRVIRQEVETGRATITEASADAVRQAGADIAGAGDREVASAADRIRSVSGDEADAIAAAGDTATSEALATISTAVDGGINAIDDGIIRGTTALNNATNSGVTAIGQSITAGTSEIQAATTAGTGTITDKVTASMQLLDGYVGTVSDDLARYSKAGQWTGVQTFNAPVVFNSPSISTYSSVRTSTPIAQSDYLTNICDALYVAGAYGATPLTVTSTLFASGDLKYSKSCWNIVSAATDFNAIGAWRTAYLYMNPGYTPDFRWVSPSGETGYRYRQSTYDCVRITSARLDGLFPQERDMGRPVMMGIWASNGYGAADTNTPKPVLKRPFDVTAHPAPIHSSSGQPFALEACSAYGHNVPSLMLSSGAAVMDGSDYARPAMRYMSPIDDPASIREIWLTKDGNAPENTGTIAYIRTHDGKTVRIRFGASASGGNYSAVSRGEVGKRSVATCCGVISFPNLLDLAGDNSEMNNKGKIVNPIQYALERIVTNNLVMNDSSVSAIPPNPGKAVVLTYEQAAPEKQPNRCFGGNHFGKQITIAASAQTITMTLPTGVIADVDTWSTDWCILDGTSLRIAANTSGADRYVSVWFYDPTIMPSLIFEIGITQLA